MADSQSEEDQWTSGPAARWGTTFSILTTRAANCTEKVLRGGGQAIRKLAGSRRIPPAAHF